MQWLPSVQALELSCWAISFLYGGWFRLTSLEEAFVPLSFLLQHFISPSFLELSPFFLFELVKLINWFSFTKHWKLLRFRRSLRDDLVITL